MLTYDPCFMSLCVCVCMSERMRGAYENEGQNCRRIRDVPLRESTITHHYRVIIVITSTCTTADYPSLTCRVCVYNVRRYISRHRENEAR